MSTKGTIVSKFVDQRTNKFVNYLMKEGKKSLALKLIGNTFDEMKKKGVENPEATLVKALDNVSPKIEVRPKRVGGAIFQIPTEVNPRRQLALAIRWILESARSKKGREISIFLAQELIEASQETGTAIKKKLEVYKMAEANKAFARFATVAK
jgi:small subunit ribosomal protein S7